MKYFKNEYDWQGQWLYLRTNICSHCLIIHNFDYLFSGLIKETGFNEDFFIVIVLRNKFYLWNMSLILFIFKNCEKIKWIVDFKKGVSLIFVTCICGFPFILKHEYDSYQPIPGIITLSVTIRRSVAFLAFS